MSHTADRFCGKKAAGSSFNTILHIYLMNKPHISPDSLFRFLILLQDEGAGPSLWVAQKAGRTTPPVLQ